MSAPKLTIVRDQAQGLRQMAAPPRSVKVIAVTGGKGGVGKTNITVNLAIALSGLGRRVMILDADLGLANVDVLMGIRPRNQLSDMIHGDRSLSEIICAGPAGVQVVPGSSGLTSMADLTPAHHVSIVSAFSELTTDVDVLLVDTAPGISDDVLRFAEAAQEVLMVTCNEPTSITDAYALMKVLNRERDVKRFRLVTNMTRAGGDGRALYEKLHKLTDRFLDLTLDHAGSIPFDQRLHLAVQLQKPLVQAFPGSLAAAALKNLALRADSWDIPRVARGNIEFFLERLLGVAAGKENLMA